MTKIKICGLFTEQDVHSVNNAVPDFAGFVFYEKSRRYVTAAQAHTMRQILHREIATVGVFVRAPLSQVCDIYAQKTISVIQLHGDEDESYIAQLRRLLPDAEIWQAFTLREAQDVARASHSSADQILLDNGYGTGACFDWSLLDSFERPFILAGGLTPHNLKEAIGRFRPYAVDLSTGVETDGRKDGAKICAAVEAARNGAPFLQTTRKQYF